MSTPPKKNSFKMHEKLKCFLFCVNYLLWRVIEWIDGHWNVLKICDVCIGTDNISPVVGARWSHFFGFEFHMNSF